MEEELIAALLDAATLKELVDDRIEWGWRADGDGLMAITLNVVGQVPTLTFDGNTGFTSYRVQADSWGATYREAKLVSRALIVAMEALGRPQFDSVLMLASRDIGDADPTGKPIGRTTTDFRIWHHAS